MKVLALGGCGGMGRYAVRTALTYDFVERIVVADLDGERAAAFAADCGEKASAAQIDVTDGTALRALMADANVVMNTVGPFYRLGVPVLQAAIESGTHYMDINDDWEPTLAMLELDPAAREADVTAIVGMGASPGVSNMLAAKACAELDNVNSLVTGWGLGGTGAGGEADASPASAGDRKPSAALVHWMHGCSGAIRIRRDGHDTDVKPIEEVTSDYPGIGEGTAWTVGHPEPVTLPRWKPEIKDSYNVMVGPRWLIDVVKQIGGAIDGGELTVEQGAALLTGPPPARTESAAPSSETAGAQLPPLFAVASGTKEGKRQTVAATVLAMPAGGMGGSTGVPMAVGLSLLASGAIEQRGAFAPEAVIEPDAFFNKLAPLCTPAKKDVNDMVLITRSDA